MKGNDSFFQESKGKDRSLLKEVDRAARFAKAAKEVKRSPTVAETRPEVVTDWRELVVKGHC